MKELRMHGKGGQGIVVGGETLSNAFLNIGKYLAVMPSYGVERRGSDVTAFGRLSDEPVRENCMCYEPNYLVIFDPSQISKPATYKGLLPAACYRLWYGSGAVVGHGGQAGQAGDDRRHQDCL